MYESEQFLKQLCPLRRVHAAECREAGAGTPSFCTQAPSLIKEVGRVSTSHCLQAFAILGGPGPPLRLFALGPLSIICVVAEKKKKKKEEERRKEERNKKEAGAGTCRPPRATLCSV